VVRKRRSGDAQLFLNFADDHSFGMGTQEEAHDFEAGLSPERAEALGGAGDKFLRRPGHTSIILEITK
jgi:hypothetical protein